MLVLSVHALWSVDSQSEWFLTPKRWAMASKKDKGDWNGKWKAEEKKWISLPAHQVKGLVVVKAQTECWGASYGRSHSGCLYRQAWESKKEEKNRLLVEMFPYLSEWYDCVLAPLIADVAIGTMVPVHVFNPHSIWWSLDRILWWDK